MTLAGKRFSVDLGHLWNIGLGQAADKYGANSPCGLKENAETQALRAAISSGFVEPLDELPAVRLDHTP